MFMLSSIVVASEAALDLDVLGSTARCGSQ